MATGTFTCNALRAKTIKERIKTQKLSFKLDKSNAFRIGTTHSRPQRPRSFWSAPRIATSGQVQRHCVFEWLCKHNGLRPEPIRFVKLDSEHAQSDGKSVNFGLPVLDLARGTQRSNAKIQRHFRFSPPRTS